MLKGASKSHHALNKLLPGTLVAELLESITPDNLTGSNHATAQYLLSLNGLRTIILSNFG